jgi:DNA modification methylase
MTLSLSLDYAGDDFGGTLIPGESVELIEMIERDSAPPLALLQATDDSGRFGTAEERYYVQPEPKPSPVAVVPPEPVAEPIVEPEPPAPTIVPDAAAEATTAPVVHHTDGRSTVYIGECIEVMSTMPDNSVDSIVTDPPYGLGFMGKKWDDLPPGLPWAQECLRVLKPGGHLMAFGGTRTWHRLAVAVEDAGFEIRDSIAWIYGSGFPKNMDVGKAIDKAAGVQGGKGAMKRGGERLLNQTEDGARDGQGTWGDEVVRSAYTYIPGSDDAKKWEGWGTAIKPAFEPVVVARKPLSERTVAANVLTHGTGALNIDACRVSGAKPDTTRGASVNASSMVETLNAQGRIVEDGKGRWPANVLIDDSQADALDEQSGYMKDGVAVNRNQQPDTEQNPHGIYGSRLQGAVPDQTYGGGGGASRFFPTFKYQAKAPAKERPVYFTPACTCEVEWPTPIVATSVCPECSTLVTRHAHATVKPLALMRWLVRLVTPVGGVVLDPFLGSGTTLEAALLEGMVSIGIEREVEYLPMIDQRIARVATTTTEDA